MAKERKQERNFLPKGKIISTRGGNRIFSEKGKRGVIFTRKGNGEEYLRQETGINFCKKSKRGEIFARKGNEQELGKIQRRNRTGIFARKEIG